MITLSSQNVEVIYIAFHDYGPEPLRRFMSSYRSLPADYPHELTVALKGYIDPAAREATMRMVEAAGGSTVEVPNEGFDIGTYFHLATGSRADILCLMNSNAEILCAGWLAKLVAGLHLQGGGAVSATGSWESLASDLWRTHAVKGASFPRRLWRVQRARRLFPTFPNPHLRTNAVVIERETFLSMQGPQLTCKEDAWLFESGRAGLSACLQAQRRPIAVVGNDGRRYAPEEWAESATFWQGEQANLLIADNQTRRYQDGSVQLRAELYSLAWNAPVRLGGFRG